MCKCLRGLTVPRWRPWGPLGPGSLMYTTGPGHCPCRAGGAAASRLHPLTASPTGGARPAAAAWTRPAGATPCPQLWKQRVKKGHSGHQARRHAVWRTICCRKNTTYALARGRGWSFEGWWRSSGWGFPASPPVICLLLRGSGWSSSAPLVWRAT